MIIIVIMTNLYTINSESSSKVEKVTEGQN